MPKHFNTAGPCQSDIHYMLSPTARLPDLKALIHGRNYFIIHAPRQVGKTTAMIALAQELTDSGEYTAIMLSLEVGAPFSQDPGMAERAILDEWQESACVYLPTNLHPPRWPPSQPGRQIGAALASWAKVATRPLVVFLDEIDALADETLISVLRQLRSGYNRRPHSFPHSVGLIGMRDVRDYKVKSGGSERLNTSSPFNIKAESLTLSNFTLPEVEELYLQHTQATGQVFATEAIQRAYYLTEGQPWLVNALARQATQVLVKDVTQPITAEVINQAKEILIQRQDTHLDSLAERLREERVKAIIQPMLSGSDLPDTPEDDRRFLLDLGLVKRSPLGGLTIANPIYQEVIPRVLSQGSQDSLPQIQPTWLNTDNTLNPDKLLNAFLEFWRQHGEPLLRSAPYHEIAPHLVLMAFLHRVVNGGGTLEREYAIGSGRMDICLRYGKVMMGIELKVRREKLDPLTKGLTQLDKYLDGLGLDTGWLVIFDHRPGLPPMGERISKEEAISPRGRTITVIRS
ncbi:polyketide biosynthesis operon protein CyrO [Cylindrospermopsis raciborskii]|uniref:polyketide biosynthesis operon protein CyrO n=1 Tax=Cylindrospermopsis raciborskii TaxID=77022 RepID=UPI0008DD55A1|nr:polyketide biosynthesis operon protein CyrO [Cylindrospermopsis raciborskii]OHY31435.1 polyketide biosynthesis operon protein CyrO [Cylindrospermopsis raciborskii MVCC14]